MKKKKKSAFSFPFLKPSLISVLIAGVAIGIVSQRFPRLRAYTDEFIRPIENSPLFRDFKSKTVVYKDHSSADSYITPSYHHVQTKPFSDQPISSFIIHRPSYSLAYDARSRNPLWVYEHLTNENIKGETERSLVFKEDDNIPPHLRATLIDYKGSGFDRGHQAPAADHRSSQEAMADTFYLTNMCPQCPQFNRGYWPKVEKHVRDLTKTYQNVYVITGPLYLPYQEVDGKHYVKYQVIGPNFVAVPTHFFKVISLEGRQGIIETKAYILPNQEIASTTPLDKFQTTIQKVESAAGIIFQ
jgi:endonuclease G, mitochondrial